MLLTNVWNDNVNIWNDNKKIIKTYENMDLNNIFILIIKDLLC